MARGERSYEIPDGPWTSMLDSVAPTTREVGAALLIQNAYPLDPSLGEGLVGRVARLGQPVNAADAPSEKGFRYMPETGEELFSSFLGVPIQRVGEKLGVLVVQSKIARQFSEDDIYALDVVAMVLDDFLVLGEVGFLRLKQWPVVEWTQRQFDP